MPKNVPHYFISKFILTSQTHNKTAKSLFMVKTVTYHYRITGDRDQRLATCCVLGVLLHWWGIWCIWRSIIDRLATDPKASRQSWFQCVAKTFVQVLLNGNTYVQIGFVHMRPKKLAQATGSFIMGRKNAQKNPVRCCNSTLIWWAFHSGARNGCVEMQQAYRNDS